jgi:hypothetical protein
VVGSKYTAQECFARLLACHLARGLPAAAFKWQEYSPMRPPGQPVRRPFRLSAEQMLVFNDIVAHALFLQSMIADRTFRANRPSLMPRCKLTALRLKPRKGIHLRASGLAPQSAWLTKTEIAVRLTLEAQLTGLPWESLVYRADEWPLRAKPKAAKARGRKRKKAAVRSAETTPSTPELPSLGLRTRAATAAALAAAAAPAPDKAGFGA